MLQSLIKSLKETFSERDDWVECKRIQRILTATCIGDKQLSALFIALEPHLSSLEWVDALKALTTVHYIIREDSTGDILDYLSRRLYILSPCFSLSALPHGNIIECYAKYLVHSIILYNDTGFVQLKRLEVTPDSMTIYEKYLEETESIHKVLSAALKCHEKICIINKMLNTASKLLVLDIEILFQALSKRLIHLLVHSFELSRPMIKRLSLLSNEFRNQTQAVERCLNARLRSKSQIKLLPLQPLSALEDYLKSDCDTFLCGINTEPINETNHRDLCLEKELPKPPNMEICLEEHVLEIGSKSKENPGADLLLIDL